MIFTLSAAVPFICILSIIPWTVCLPKITYGQIVNTLSAFNIEIPVWLCSLPLTHEKYNPFWKVAWNSRARKKKCWLMRLNSEMYITGAGRKKAPCDELHMVTGQSKSLRWLRRITTKHFSYPTHSNHMTL